MTEDLTGILDAFDFARVASTFAAQGWKYGIAALGMSEYCPDATDLRAIGRELLADVLANATPNPYSQTGRLRAEYLDGRLRLCCIGELAAALGTDEPRANHA